MFVSIQFGHNSCTVNSGAIFISTSDSISFIITIVVVAVGAEYVSIVSRLATNQTRKWLRWLQYYPLFIWFEHNSFSIFVHKIKHRIHGSAAPPTHTQNPNPSSCRRHSLFFNNVCVPPSVYSVKWIFGDFRFSDFFCCCCFASAKWNIRIGRLRTQTHTWYIHASPSLWIILPY